MRAWVISLIITFVLLGWTSTLFVAAIWVDDPTLEVNYAQSGVVALALFIIGAIATAVLADEAGV